MKNKINLLMQFIRYSLVGFIAFCFDFTTLFLLTNFLKVPYLVSATLSFCVGLTVNYILSLKFVFKERAYKNKFFEFAVFSAIGLIGLVFNDLLMWLFTDKLQLFYLISKIIATIFVYIWNFGARKYILFVKKG